MSASSTSTGVGRTARVATAGLVGLLLAAAPPPAAARDDDRRDSYRGERHRGERGDRDRDDRRREARREHRERDDRRGERRDDGPPRIGGHRSERAHPPRVARNDHRHDHRRDDRRWREARRDHRDHREWREDRQDRHDHRHRWRGLRHEDRKWRPARVARHDGRWHWHDGRWCPPGHRNPPGRRVGWYEPRDDWRWARYRRPPVVHSPYYCAPCSHWYGQRHDFDRHVYGYHGLPQRSFQDAVAQLAWGLVYFGM